MFAPHATEDLDPMEEVQRLDFEQTQDLNRLGVNPDLQTTEEQDLILLSSIEHALNQDTSHSMMTGH